MARLHAWWRKRGQSLKPRLDAISRRGPGRGALTAAAVILLLLGGFSWWRSSKPALDFVAHDSVLLADFENGIADPIFDSSLYTAFTIALTQSTHVNVITRSRTAAALRWMGKRPGVDIDELTGREISLREKARGLILCKLFWDGPRYAFSARLVDPRTGDVARSYVETAATLDGVLEAVDRVVYRLRRDLGESRLSIRRHNRSVTQAATPSVQSLKLYVDGLGMWRAGQSDRASELFRLALQHDPDFPLLHAALASIYAEKNPPEPRLAQQHYEIALKGERLTDRDRLSIQASYAASTGRQAESIDLYRAFLKLYPDAHEARYSLGTLLLRNNRLDEAAEQFRQSLRLWPGSAAAHVNLATCLVLTGKPTEALAEWEKAFVLEPQWRTRGDNLTHEYGFTLAASGQEQKARGVFETALAGRGPHPAILRSLALLDMYEGRHRAAGDRLREAAALDETVRNASTAAQIHQLLAIVAEARGDRAAAIRELDDAARELETARGERALQARIGCIYARAGAVDRAERILQELKRNAAQAGKAEAGYLSLLEGQIALAHGDFANAIRLSEAATSGAPELGFALLARAYAAAGQPDRSVQALEKVVAMPSQALGWEAQQAWMESHAELARAYLERGDRARAAKTAAALADHWKAADTDLPLARDIAALSEKLR